MKLFTDDLVTSIKNKDLSLIKDSLSRLSDTERRDALTTSTCGCVVIRRPSSHSDVTIYKPSPLMLAVSEQCSEVVTYLAAFQVNNVIISINCRTRCEC